MSQTFPEEVEKFFHEQIPLTRAMGVRVVSSVAAPFAVRAPVALNHNHLRTAFGGSVNALATLAAYGFLWLEVRAEAAQVVIAASSIRFLQPIRENISATCAKPPAAELAAFKAQLREKGKARITLAVHVEEDGLRAAEFVGTFVAYASG